MENEQDVWLGRISGRTDPSNCPVLLIANPHDSRDQGGSRPFLAVDEKGLRWYVKVLTNPQGPRVVLNEYLVGSLGRLIDAPVCETSVVRIPDDLAGMEFCPGRKLEEGFAHGSLEVTAANNVRALSQRDKDDNSRRHAGVLALYDWCWGNDDQWLYQTNDDMRLFSHDHGHYFPGGPNWTVQSLNARADQPHLLNTPPLGVDEVEVLRIAGGLRSVTREDLGAILGGVPASWPVTREELEALGAFVLERAPRVSDRLESFIGGIK